MHSLPPSEWLFYLRLYLPPGRRTAFFSSNLQEQLRLMLTPQPGAANPVTSPQPQLRIGIVGSHNGKTQRAGLHR